MTRAPGEGVMLLTAESVGDFARLRRGRARSGTPALTAARYLAGRLRPPADPLTVDGRSIYTGEPPRPPAPPTREELRARRDGALTGMPALRAVFSADVLDAVTLPDGAGCRWCASDVAADEVFADRDGDNQAAYRLLFGSEPCARDLARWSDQATEIERAQAAQQAAARAATADSRMRTDALRLAELKVGFPYAERADGPMSFNCVGLVRWAYANAAGVLVPEWNLPLLAAGEQIALDGLEPGDLVVNEPADHIGIYAGDGRVLHASSGAGGVAYTSLEGFTSGVRLSRAGLVASGAADVDSGSLAALTALAALREVAADEGITLAAS
ncbi:C40 family peptidase [Streptomyces sp. NPDC059680]|uniref:C40 family peptidase n=1 Tax=Streptomyces sp. NPDC059680 TaxID=3346904 RepID=UPI003690B1F3